MVIQSGENDHDQPVSENGRWTDQAIYGRSYWTWTTEIGDIICLSLLLMVFLRSKLLVYEIYSR